MQEMQDGYEYMTFDLVKPKRDIDELNQLGRDGWKAEIGRASCRERVL